MIGVQSGRGKKRRRSYRYRIDLWRSVYQQGNVMVQAKQKWQVTIQDLQAGIAKTPGSAQMTWEQATLAIALMERLEKIDQSLEALRQSILSI